ncbi:MAG: AAA family ATPase [Peptococcaceae bacterium]|jgi:chromosome segregation ATPase|nr:AAA family ATPase [Peptococcaceae bacterium]
MVKINKLEIENVKRIKAVQLEPKAEGLTVIGGRNRQGKTSVIDAIAWALGGDRFRPSQAQREGALTPPDLRVELDNGLIVERRGKNSELKVTDPSGRRGGQQLLNEFVEQLALDLPRFMQASSREKANTLLQIIGLREQLAALEGQEQDLYNRRRSIGQIATQKAKYAEELPFDPTAPTEPVSVSELIRQQQEILARNGENQRKRAQAASLQAEKERLRRQLADLQARYDEICCSLEIAQKSAAALLDESTAELEENIANIEQLNRRVQSNLDRERALDEVAQYQAEYDGLSEALEQCRQAKLDLLAGAQMPLPGLSVAEGELVYQGQRWDNMSASEQLRVAVAVVRRLNPKCGFVLLDKLEQMDLPTLQEFGSWLEAEGLQVIATRVSTGGECSVIIEDGYIKEPEQADEAAQVKLDWKAGVF